MDSPTRSQSDDIPSISRLIERLIAELSTIEPHNNNNTTDPPTTALPPQSTSTSTQQGDIPNQNPFHSLLGSQLSKVKSLMLTLHCLFPNELLLALDILDRKLVRRFVSIKQTEDGNGNAAEYPSGSSHDMEEIPDSQEEEEEVEVNSPPDQQPSTREEIFLVLSTSSVTSQSSRRVPEKYYEVRLRAWNCTCPGFVLSAFRNLGEEDVGVQDEGMDEYHSGRWLGGTLTRTMSGNSAPPMCKHLLACILATMCTGLFGNGLQERIDVSQTEMAGWAAGWGG